MFRMARDIGAGLLAVDHDVDLFEAEAERLHDADPGEGEGHPGQDGIEAEAGSHRPRDRQSGPGGEEVARDAHQEPPRKRPQARPDQRAEVQEDRGVKPGVDGPRSLGFGEESGRGEPFDSQDDRGKRGEETAAEEAGRSHHEEPADCRRDRERHARYGGLWGPHPPRQPYFWP